MLYKATLKHLYVYILLILFSLLLFLNITIKTEQQFVELAQSFIDGSLSFTNHPKKLSDTSLYNNQYFWPLGPLPAVLIIPFVSFIKPFYQGYIQFPLNLLNFYLVYKISQNFNLVKKKSLILATFFIFGSIYTPLGALPASWYYAQVVGCTLLLLAIYEFLNKKRFFVIGIYIALATATRFNLILTSLFFIYFLLKKPFSMRNLFYLVLPIFISVAVLGIYNKARYNSFLESGYNLQLIPAEPKARRDIGLFSIQHIPSNLFYMLLKGPEPLLKDNSHILIPPYITFDSYGMSIFFLSPILFLIFFANYKKKVVKASFITSLIVAIPIITYYGIGQKQVGYRYALDFLPFLLLIVANATKRISIKILLPLVLFGVLFSIYFTLIYMANLEI